MSLVTGGTYATSLPLDDATIQTVVTSPPYWGQRDYGYTGQAGKEASYQEYLDWWEDVAEELWRVVKPDGTVWLVVGDTFNTRAIIRPSAHQTGLGHDSEHLRLSWAEARDKGLVRYSSSQPGLKDKDLMGLPWRMALLMQAIGWWLRCDVVWSKPFNSPENALDRPSRNHEYIFLFSKAKRYLFHKTDFIYTSGSVWRFQPTREVGGHSAAFPSELVQRCLEATSNEGDVVLDPFAGSGTTVRVANQMGRKGVGYDAAPQPLIEEWRR